MLEEGGQQIWVGVDVAGGFPCFGVKFRIVLRNVICEENIFHPLPTLFDRVQLRRVRRKIFKDKPFGMCTLKKILCRDVGRESIPNDDHPFFEMMMQFDQPEDKVLGDARAVHDREMKCHFATGRCCTDKAEPRLVTSRVGFAQDRRLTNFGPSRAKDRRERETAFVHENQECAEFLRFFLIRFHALRVQRRTSSSEYLCDFTTGFCGESLSVGRMYRTLREVISIPNLLRMRSVTLREVQRSEGYPALIAPPKIISLRRSFSSSDKPGGLPDPFFRARQVMSLLFALSFRRQRLTLDSPMSRIHAMSSSSYPLRINSPP